MIQLPCVFLLLIAYIGEFLAYGHGIRIQEFFVILFCFMLMMLVNFIIESIILNLIKMQAKRFAGIFWEIGRRSLVAIRGATNNKSSFLLLPIELRKCLILLRNRKRHFLIGGFILTLLCSLGWGITLISSPEQPKLFLWTLIFGFILLGIIPASYELNNLDRHSEIFLLTLPTSIKKQSFINFKVLLWLVLPFFLQVATWPFLTPDANYGWKSALVILLIGVALIGCSYIMRGLSKKGFILNFILVILMMSWVAESLRF